MIGTMNPTIIQTIAVAAIPLLFAITLHEVAHGWMASKLGDKTALMLGRLSINPLKHIDPLGTVILPLVMLILGGVIFGWAKPVPVAWQNLHNPRRDMAFVALAGPAANLLMALFWAIIAKLCLLTMVSQSPVIFLDIQRFIYTAANFGIYINIILMALNLLPIPPLDGSRVVSSLLPPKLSLQYDRIEPYGIWILLAMLFLGILGYILWPPVILIINSIKALFGLP